MMWLAFNPEKPLPDGDYIARLIVPGRVDNPQYTKLKICGGVPNIVDVTLITHYMIPPALDAIYYEHCRGDLSWLCPGCGKFIREPITNHIDNVCECGIEASMEWRDHSVHPPVED